MSPALRAIRQNAALPHPNVRATRNKTICTLFPRECMLVASEVKLSLSPSGRLSTSRGWCGMKTLPVKL